jgi:hypothetical protein
VPTLLRGYPSQSQLPGIERLASRVWYLGKPRRFIPFAALSTENMLAIDAMPCCDDFRVDGTPALPVSLCLEFLLSIGDWAVPQGMRWAGMRGAAVELGALPCAEPGEGGDDGRLTLLSHVDGRWVDRDWVVSATLTRADHTPVANAELIYRTAPTPGDRSPGGESHSYDSTTTQVGDAGLPEDVADVLAQPVLLLPRRRGFDGPAFRLSWSGHAFRLAGWRRHPDAGCWYGLIAEERVADLLVAGPTPTSTPLSALGLHQIENVIRAGYLAQMMTRRGGGDAQRLEIGWLWCDARRTGTAGWLCGDASGDDWTGFDARGHQRLRIQGMTFL